MKACARPRTVNAKERFCSGQQMFLGKENRCHAKIKAGSDRRVSQVRESPAHDNLRGFVGKIRE
jgi:hypothetical protein